MTIHIAFSSVSSGGDITGILNKLCHGTYVAVHYHKVLYLNTTMLWLAGYSALATPLLMSTIFLNYNLK